MSDEQLTNKAEVIVIGKVLSAFSEKQGSGDIVTFITIHVADQIKGKHNSEDLTIKTFGGQAGGQIMYFPGASDYFRNAEVMLLLERGSDGYLIPIGMVLGKYSIYRDSETGRKIVMRYADGNGQYFSNPREDEPFLSPGDRVYLSDFRERIEKFVKGGR